MRYGALIAVIVLAFIGFLIIKAQKSPSTNTSSTSATNVAIADKKIEEISASMHYKIDVVYPSLQGLSNTKAQDYINKDVEELMKKQVDEFKNNFTAAEQAPGLPQQMQEEVVNELTAKYDTGQADDTIVSYHFTFFENIIGMAHPNNFNMTYTYDVKNNKELKISDLFKKDSNYLEKLSEFSRKEITNKLGKDVQDIASFADVGAAPEEINFQKFTLSPSDLTLYFDPSAVAPTFAGSQTVVIPLSSLSDVLNPNFLK